MSLVKREGGVQTSQDFSLSREEDSHEEICFECKDGGDLLCCDGCTGAIHLYCIRPPLGPLKIAPEGAWFCDNCLKSPKSLLAPAPDNEWELPSPTKLPKPNRQKSERKKGQVVKKSQKGFWSKCNDVLGLLKNSMHSSGFLKPMDSKEESFHDYIAKIKKPMDFQTLTKKLTDNRYQSLKEFESDTRLIWLNAFLFYPEDHPRSHAAKQLKTIFERIWIDIEKRPNDRKISEKFVVGDRVLATWNAVYHAATIEQVNEDGTYALVYDDGDRVEKKAPTQIRLVAALEVNLKTSRRTDSEDDLPNPKRQRTQSVDGKGVNPLRTTQEESQNPKKTFYRITVQDSVIKTEQATLQRLKQRISACCPTLPEKYQLSYVDEDDVTITIFDDECLTIFYGTALKDLKVKV